MNEIENLREQVKTLQALLDCEVGGRLANEEQWREQIREANKRTVLAEQISKRLREKVEALGGNMPPGLRVLLADGAEWTNPRGVGARVEGGALFVVDDCGCIVRVFAPGRWVEVEAGPAED